MLSFLILNEDEATDNSEHVANPSHWNILGMILSYILPILPLFPPSPPPNFFTYSNQQRSRRKTEYKFYSPC
jgi:hypothetical protein